MRHPSAHRQSSARRGFTLIEIMITVAIVGILAAIALPQYSQYVMRGKVVEGFNGLTAYSMTMGQYYQDNRVYYNATSTTCNAGTAFGNLPPTTTNFSYGCDMTATSATTFRIVATGTGPMTGFKFTLDQNGNRMTQATPASSGWPTSTTTPGCWIASKSGTCY